MKEQNAIRKNSLIENESTRTITLAEKFSFEYIKLTFSG